MKSVNTVTLLGNVTRDAELKQTQTGQSVCTFGLATNRVWKDKSGEKQSLAEFHNIVVWGNLADICGSYVKKGKPLYAEGYLKTRTWEDDKKQKHYKTEIVAQNVVLLGSRPESEADDASAGSAPEDMPADEELASDAE